MPLGQVGQSWSAWNSLVSDRKDTETITYCLLALRPANPGGGAVLNRFAGRLGRLGIHQFVTEGLSDQTENILIGDLVRLVVAISGILDWRGIAQILSRRSK